MILKDNLYKISSIDVEDENYKIEVLLDAGHEIFKGHFPEQPVLPGVCLLEMLKELISEVKGKAYRLKEAGNIKYLKLVDPRNDPKLTLLIHAKEGEAGLTVNASSLLSGGDTNFKIKATFS
ncbi:3-hydroxyacyl-ACP dehydratase [Cytophagaceae bacterium ABcell3]|nr:3-hydroxyacyl-ACP dehydratase [Cytophagaceae bacterium ABcell3]